LILFSRKGKAMAKKKYKIYRKSLDQITMKAKAINPYGKIVTLSATWVWAPDLSFYDEDAKVWISKRDWEYTEQRCPTVIT